MSTLLSARPLINSDRQSTSNGGRLSARGASVAPTLENPNLTKLMQSYQADQQLKYLHLQAEVEVLLQQLQTLKQRRLAETPSQTER
ncbi:hypothetical protein [Oscillatoria sp. FACHB-1406]|uniref:hypothetical protein n=1 Tax=Oscillatoria sp. FACHB-1406 TaxID=2692846 RepID=UPI001683841F|nr:hypothetical protein [Oscillatoria sp. FACHB-1406]MBD2577250.1 hypothetical protein [Oscillatoria sp. FACHB-1406]